MKESPLCLYPLALPRANGCRLFQTDISEYSNVKKVTQQDAHLHFNSLLFTTPPTKTSLRWFFAGIDSRADGSTISNNYIEDADGAGIRLGGPLIAGRLYGQRNKVRCSSKPYKPLVCGLIGNRVVFFARTQITRQGLSIPNPNKGAMGGGNQA